MVETSRPNILFILADDWGWGDLGCYGHPVVQTPHLDALAASGMLFTQFYVCSGVCSPSRAAFMTGRFPAHYGIHGHLAAHEQNARRGMPNWLDPSVTTYTRLFQEQGYAVGHYGKWHLGHGEGAPEPSAYGIDESKVNAGNGPQIGFPVVYRSPEESGSRTRSSEIIVDQAIGFIERHRDGPFLVNVWLNDTHATLDPDEKQLEPYRHLMPQGLEGKHVGANAIYYAVVSEADRQIGRLLRRLDALGLAENTVVIFTADNGPEEIQIRNASHSGVGSPGPFRGRKRSLYEGGVRVPFLLRWPAGGTPAGVVNDVTPLCAVDLLPTFCRLAGIDVPAGLGLEGEEMSAAFRGEPQARSTPLYWEWRFHVHGHTINRSPMLALRQGDWKLLLNPDYERVELYHVPSDPSELTNLADRYTLLVTQLCAQALAWQATLPKGPRDPTAGLNDYPWPGRG